MADTVTDKPRVRVPAGSSPAKPRVRVPAGSSPVEAAKPRVRVPAGSSPAQAAPRPAAPPVSSQAFERAPGRLPPMGPAGPTVPTRPGGILRAEAEARMAAPRPAAPAPSLDMPARPAGARAVSGANDVRPPRIPASATPVTGTSAASTGLSLGRRLVGGAAGVAGDLLLSPNPANRNEAADLERMMPRGADGRRTMGSAVMGGEPAEASEATGPRRGPMGPEAPRRPAPRPMGDARDNSADMHNRLELARIARVNRGDEADRPPQFAKGGFVAGKKGVNPFAKAGPKMAKGPSMPPAPAAKKANPFAAPAKVGKSTPPTPAAMPPPVPAAKKPKPPAMPALPFSKGGMVKGKKR